MTRFKFTVEYDGGPFVGWQRQDDSLSVQQVLEEALEKMAGVPTLATAAGRTDAGVHAKGQVVHADIEVARSEKDMRDGLNYYLKPYPVSILAAEIVPDSFNARTSAKEREYLYRILNRRAPAAIDRGRIWHIPFELDVEPMHQAAQTLLGHHDFTSFRAASCQAKSPMRTLDELSVFKVGEEIHLKVRARSFLHHQVRNMTGTLVEVGKGKWQIGDVRRALDACSRASAGPTAPPDGLYFMCVRY